VLHSFLSYIFAPFNFCIGQIFLLWMQHFCLAIVLEDLCCDCQGESPDSNSALVDFETTVGRQEFIEKMMAGKHY